MSNESTATEQASGDEDVYRLRDILVEEVSLVDRPPTSDVFSS